MFKSRIAKWRLVKYKKRRKEDELSYPPDYIICPVNLKRISSRGEVHSLIPKPRSITSPNDIEIPERVLQLLEQYILISVQTGRWKPFSHRESSGADEHTPCSSSEVSSLVPQGSGDAAEDFSSHVLYGCFALDNRDCRGTERALAKASASLDRILKRDNPSTVLALLSLLELKRRGRHELAICLLRQMSELASIKLGKNHPLPNMCRTLVMTDLAFWEEILRISLQKSIHVCAMVIEAVKSVAMDGAVPCHRGEVFKCPVQRMKVLCGQEGFQQPDVRVLYVCMDYARTAARLGLLVEAIHIVKDVLAHDTTADRQQMLVWRSKAFMLLARLHGKENKRNQAKEATEEAVKLILAETEWGGYQDLWFLLELETQLLNFGMNSEAARIRDRRVQAAQLLNNLDDT